MRLKVVSPLAAAAEFARAATVSLAAALSSAAAAPIAVVGPLAGTFALGVALSGCATMGVRSAVDLTVEVEEETPGSALVYIDEQYIGTLRAVEVRGLRLPEGEHRISIEKTGYFPYDTVVVSDLKPIHLKVRLLRLPE